MQGDFSHAVPNGATPVDSFGNPDLPTCANASGCVDPNVAAFLQANPYFQSNAALAAQAIIDPATFDPAAQAYIAAKLPTASR